MQQNGGGDQIKKLKKEKSMEEADPDGLKKDPKQSSQLRLNQTQHKKPSSSKVINELPNYVKPTSRFDAKDKLRVSSNSLSLSSKIKSLNNSENPNSSKSSSSSGHPGSKAIAKEDLVRNSSLKPVRSSMKKNSGVGLHPTVNIGRATCSSTVKIARNPESSDLDERDRASNCSYKYCSLHGQKKHEVFLPALKCFLSAKRQSIKSPDSVKQREQLSTRKNGDKVVYSKRQEGTLQQKSCEEISQDEVGIVDIVNGVNWMIQGDHDETNQLQESYSVTSFEDYNNSEISIEEIEVLDEPIQYIEDEVQEEAHLETDEGKTDHVDREEQRGLYLQSQINSSQCFDDFLGQTLDNHLESSVEDCKFTTWEENSLSTSKHAGADSKLSPEVDSELFPEVEDVKVDNEIQQSTTFSYASKEESNGSLQSGFELPKSPNELPEEDLENLKVHCEKEDDLKANVENTGCFEPSKHETNYESQQGIRTNCDEDGKISDGLENEKENATNSTSFISENPLAELTNMSKEKYSTMRKLTAENQENGRKFNQRPPRFHPLKPEQEAEVVNLKHQTVEKRKTAEEWMIDYTLRNTLRRLAPARKRKVALLVAAFESIIQQEQCTTMP